MKSTSAIHPAITENMEDILVKRVLHILISQNYRRLVFSNVKFALKHNKHKIEWEVPLQSLCLTLKKLCVYCISSFYAGVK